jgi:glutaredoxin-related protein
MLNKIGSSQGHTLLGKIAGADAPALASAIALHLAPHAAVPAPLSSTNKAPTPAISSASEAEETPADFERRLRALMSQHHVMLFMKGVPDAPRCGFSRKAVALLRDQGIEFGSFDILSDEGVRAGKQSDLDSGLALILQSVQLSGMKVINNWPTFPQFHVDGVFIGGLDVVTEMDANGELAEVLGNGT